MAWLVERAVARQVATSQFTACVVNGHREIARQQSITVPTDRFRPPQIKAVGIAPLRGSSDDDDLLGKPGPLPSRSLVADRHPSSVDDRRQVGSQISGEVSANNRAKARNARPRCDNASFSDAVISANVRPPPISGSNTGS